MPRPPHDVPDVLRDPKGSGNRGMSSALAGDALAARLCQPEPGQPKLSPITHRPSERDQSGSPPRAEYAAPNTNFDGTVVRHDRAAHVLRCDLIWCPEVPHNTRYVFVRRHQDGTRRGLGRGVLTDPAPSLNLAHLRQRGAQLGANEVVLILPQGCALPAIEDVPAN